jgi:hypothetical protein
VTEDGTRSKDALWADAGMPDKATADTLAPLQWLEQDAQRNYWPEGGAREHWILDAEAFS